MNPTDIHLLLTGDELMSGDTVDSNSAMIAQSLAAFGHGVAEKVTLGDLSLIHISEPTRPEPISYAVFCLKKKKS